MSRSLYGWGLPNVWAPERRVRRPGIRVGATVTVEFREGDTTTGVVTENHPNYCKVKIEEGELTIGDNCREVKTVKPL